MFAREIGIIIILICQNSGSVEPEQQKLVIKRAYTCLITKLFT